MSKKPRKFSKGDLVKFGGVNSSHSHARSYSDIVELFYYTGEVGEIYGGGPNVFYVKLSTTNKLGQSISKSFRAWIDEIELIFSQ